ncbi:MAG TPA: response regulator [Candidatus Dormibacteraeota bacterium]|nr:response regulator [Candidatus Dormibacteraeota bacterium]
MPKRLLFVDDEPNVLDGLRRSLHGMRKDWEMHFVGGAAAALQALEQAPYDAVVSDMRMPVMDGAELLDQVKQGYPDMVRLILSGQSSREAVYRSIAPAHQYLSKPCDPRELVARLSQAFAMRDLLSNQTLKTVISRLRSIPSLPTLYEELTASLRKEDPSLSQIAKIISKDVGMAAKILQLANSAFVGASGRVSSLVQGLSLIGTETVRTLVLSVHVFSQFDGKSHLAAILPAIWDHSVAVSSLAQRIAVCENSSKAMAEESFTAGLLHDVGKVVLLAEMPREYQAIFEQGSGSIQDRERERLGCTHAEIGAYLMSIWGIPLPLVHAVAFHHHPSEAAETHFSPLTAVHVADAIASASDGLALNHDIEMDMSYLDSLGLREREAVWRGLYTAPAAPQKDLGLSAKV